MRFKILVLVAASWTLPLAPLLGQRLGCPFGSRPLIKSLRYIAVGGELFPKWIFPEAEVAR